MPPVVAALGPIALNLAIGIGASVLAQIVRPQRQTSSQATSRGLSFELTLGESVSVSQIWGRGRTGGQLTFAQEYANNNWLKFKIDCGYGHYDALETVIADEKVMTLTGSNANIHGKVVEEYRDAGGTPRMWIKAYDGRPGQAADAGLIAAAPTRWGTAHTATARPYVVVTLNYQADMFPNSALPKFGFVWRGLRLYDWRKDSTMPGGLGTQRWNDQSTWTWSDNPAVIAWNWRRGYWRNGVKLMGMGFSRYANDLQYFTAAANLSDEELYFQETGSSLPRYAFGREIMDDEEHLAVLRQIEESWCGASFDRGGAYAPVPAASVVPVLTLKDHHRMDGAAVQADKWGTVSSKKTNIHGTYASITDMFVPTPYASRISLDLQALTRGPKAQKFDQPYEHRAERAQMRAEIRLRRNFFGATRKETFNTIGEVLEAGDAIIRDCEWGPTLMIVDSIEKGPDGLGKTVSMVAWSNTIVPDPDEGFLELPPANGVSPVPPARTLQLQDLDIQQYQRVTAGNEEPYARATWQTIEDPNCDQVMIRVWPDGEIEADTAEDFFADARLQSAKIFGPLRPLTTYRRKGLVTRQDGRQTYWTSEGTFTTGPFVAAVSVADGSIMLKMLGQELQNAHGLVTGEGAGSIAASVKGLEDLQERLALAVLDLDANVREQIRVLKVQKDGGIAAVIRTEKAVVEQGKAFAQLLDEVVASLDDLVAGGFLKMEAQVDELAAFATILMKARASAGATLSQAALIIRAEADGLGGSNAYVGALGAFYVFESVDGPPIPVFSATADGVRFNRGSFMYFRSIPQTASGAPLIELDGETGFWSFGGG